jgi:ubiquitin C-terminal hydrolase
MQNTSKDPSVKPKHCGTFCCALNLEMFRFFKDNSKHDSVVGLDNFGNTCYINSVLQCLYHITLFRDNLIIEKSDKHLTASLRALFIKLKNTKRSQIAPSDFVASVKKEFLNFRNMSHQDAHELFNFTMNYIIHDLSDSKESPTSMEKKDDNWVQKLFGGTLTNSTTCITCENVTSRDEDFLDVSLDVCNGDLLKCIQEFEKYELLDGRDKFFCEADCNGSYQEAKRRFDESL